MPHMSRTCDLGRGPAQCTRGAKGHAVPMRDGHGHGPSVARVGGPRCRAARMAHSSESVTIKSAVLVVCLALAAA